MSFFDGIGATIAQKSNEVAAMTRDMVDATSMTGQISKLNKVLQQQYQVLGEHYFQENAEVVEDPFVDDLEQIRATLQEITSLKMKVEQLKSNSASASVQASQMASYCPACGTKLSEGSIFCTSCGTKL